MDNSVERDFVEESSGNEQQKLTPTIFIEFEQRDEKGENEKATTSHIIYSLLIVTFLSLISQVLSLMQTTKEVNPHPHIAPRVHMWSVFLFCFFLCHYLNCWCVDLRHCPGRPSGIVGNHIFRRMWDHKFPCR